MGSKKSRNAEKRLQELLDNNKKAQSSNLIKAVCAVFVVAIIGVIITISALNSAADSKKKEEEKADSQNSSLLPINSVWNENMVLGNTKAKNHFVEYTDLFCPYCQKFSEQVFNHIDEVKQKYLNNDEFFLEVRVVNSLDFGEKPTTNNSTLGGEAAYCAAEQGKFFEFYEKTLARIKREYFDKGIGAYHGAPEIEQLDKKYFKDQADEVGIDSDKWTKCIDGGSGEKQVNQARKSSVKDANGGLPYFRFNSFKTSGFNGDWNQVQQMFAAGLKK